ncbi:DNA-binding SARP family transcriptional activator/tetratricopeptide (TPR) repeat protein [Streptacidiphilus sp. BW17]
MRFTILGRVSVSDDSPGAGPLVLEPGIPCTVLTALLLNANNSTSREQLATVVWGEDRPATAIASLRNHVLRLRRRLGPEAGARIRTVGGGYLVDVGDGELDVQEFTDRCRQGRQALRDEDWARAAQLLSGAVTLWGGAPFAGLPPTPEIGAQVHHLEETRLLALESRLDADLRLGRHQELVAELRTLVADHPLREAFHSRLMLALYRADRRAEALEVFHRLRRTLVDELGVEPSAAARDLQQRILAGAADLAPPVAPTGPTTPTALSALTGPQTVRAPRTSSSPSASRSGPRHQLPADTRTFTGRSEELAQLLDLPSSDIDTADPATVVISAIDGMGGIGKSALAVHAAHRLRDRFPDGQFFLDLHGHTKGVDPMAPGDALEWLLNSLGVPAPQIPDELDRRAALYRDRLAGRRTLILLDNAESTAQVQPLLPGAGGCLVLVTSRRRLSGLDDAHLITLGTLTTAEAVVLLRRIAGEDRIPADAGPEAAEAADSQEAAAELVALCGHLPLAVRIAAARLRHERSLTVADLTRQLRDEQARFDHLADEDRSTAAVFELSYAALPEPEQRLFRRLGLIPGTEIDAVAAARLIAEDRRTAARLLASLLDHNLLLEPAPGRYRFHDLVRLFARTLGATEPLAVQQEAVGQLTAHYLDAARAADRLLARTPRPGDPASTIDDGPTAPQPDDRTSALAWMRRERDNLVACATHAAEHGRPARAVALTAAMAAFLHTEGPWAQAAVLHRNAAELARGDGDGLAEANALVDLARVLLTSGEVSGARRELEQALTVYQQVGDRLGRATARWELGRIEHMAADYTAASAHHEAALALYRELDAPTGVASALYGLARARRQQGDLTASAALCAEALTLFRQGGDTLGQANATFEGGLAHREAEGRPTAMRLTEQALALYRQAGSPMGEGNALNELGRLCLLAGDHDAADGHLRQGLTIFHRLDQPHGQAIALNDLALVRDAVGDHASAVDLLEQALDIYLQLGARLRQAEARRQLGRALAALGKVPEAAAQLRLSAELFDTLGDPDRAAEVRAELASVG